MKAIRKTILAGVWIPAVVLFLHLFYGMAAAHNVTVFAWVDGDRVRVESKFSGGRRPQNAPIEVFDSAGKLLLSGMTDEKGEFSFKVPVIADLKIVLHAGMGHQAEWTVRESEITDVSSNSATQTPAPKSGAVLRPEGDVRQSSAREDPTGGSSKTGHDTAVEETIEKILDRKLKPVMTLLMELRDPGPSVTEVIGGIGYIIGLVGITAYFKSRRKDG